VSFYDSDDTEKLYFIIRESCDDLQELEKQEDFQNLSFQTKLKISIITSDLFNVAYNAIEKIDELKETENF